MRAHTIQYINRCSETVVLIVKRLRAQRCFCSCLTCSVSRVLRNVFQAKRSDTSLDVRPNGDPQWESWVVLKVASYWEVGDNRDLENVAYSVSR